METFLENFGQILMGMASLLNSYFLALMKWPLLLLPHISLHYLIESTEDRAKHSFQNEYIDLRYFIEKFDAKFYQEIDIIW